MREPSPLPAVHLTRTSPVPARTPAASVAQHLHLGCVERQPAVEGEEHGGQRAAKGDRGLLVAAVPGNALLGQLDAPFRVHLRAGVGGVQMDAPVRAAQLSRRVLRQRPLRPLHDLQPLVDRVGGDIGRDLVGQSGGEGRVRAVDRHLVRHTAGPESGIADSRPAPHLGVRPGLPQRLDEQVTRLGQPRVQRGGVAPYPGPVESRHPLLGDLLPGPGAHHQRGPAQSAADMPDELLQGPLRCGGHRAVQIGARGHHGPQSACLVGDFVTVAVVREGGHAAHPRQDRS